MGTEGLRQNDVGMPSCETTYSQSKPKPLTLLSVIDLFHNRHFDFIIVGKALVLLTTSTMALFSDSEPFKYSIGDHRKQEGTQLAVAHTLVVCQD